MEVLLNFGRFLLELLVDDLTEEGHVFVVHAFVLAAFLLQLLGHSQGLLHFHAVGLALDLAVQSPLVKHTVFRSGQPDVVGVHVPDFCLNSKVRSVYDQKQRHVHGVVFTLVEEDPIV